jgi:hypothetical protein
MTGAASDDRPWGGPVVALNLCVTADGLARFRNSKAIGAAAAWPLSARAQQDERVRRIGVLLPQDQDSPVAQARIAALLQELRQLGWTGRNVRIDIHWAGSDTENGRGF